MCAAYDALPGRLKARIERLGAAFGYGGQSRPGFDLPEAEGAEGESSSPC